MLRVPRSFQKLRKGILPCFFQLLVAPGIPWLVVTQSNLCFHYHMGFSGSSPFSSLLRTFAIGFRASSTPGWSHLEILNITTTAKALFPNKVTATIGSNGLTFVGATIQLSIPSQFHLLEYHFILLESLHPKIEEPTILSLPFNNQLQPHPAGSQEPLTLM